MLVVETINTHSFLTHLMPMVCFLGYRKRPTEWNGLISNLIPKAQTLDFGKKLSNWLSNCEALNYWLTFCIFFSLPEQWTRENYVSKREESLKVSKRKEKNEYNKSNFINKKCHNMMHSDCEWKSFLSLTNKHDFSSEVFNKLWICW